LEYANDLFPYYSILLKKVKFNFYNSLIVAIYTARENNAVIYGLPGGLCCRASALIVGRFIFNSGNAPSLERVAVQTQFKRGGGKSGSIFRGHSVRRGFVSLCGNGHGKRGSALG
jgi:hypothetical protein